MSQSEDELKSELYSDEFVESATPGIRARLTSMLPNDIPHVHQYSPQGNSYVQCMVCKGDIDISGRERQYVIRCNICKEATPVRAPPDDKKYVRCLCNCLLICRAAALRIVCPRQNCHRILDIGHSQSGSRGPGWAEGMVRVVCVFCDRNFLFNMSEKKLARCPHCTKWSAVGKGYTLCCAITYILVAIIFAVAGALSVVFTLRLAKEQIGYYILYASLFLAAVLLFLRSLYYFLMPVSLILGTF